MFGSCLRRPAVILRSFLSICQSAAFPATPSVGPFWLFPCHSLCGPLLALSLPHPLWAPFGSFPATPSVGPFWLFLCHSLCGPLLALASLCGFVVTCVCSLTCPHRFFHYLVKILGVQLCSKQLQYYARGLICMRDPDKRGGCGVGG